MESTPATSGSSWVEVSRGAIAANLRLLTGLLSPGCEPLAVVKANGYGHGLLPVAALCREAGVRWLGVHSAPEIAALRGGGHRGPILAMGYLTAAEIEATVDPEVHVLLSSREVLHALAAHGRRLGVALPVHVKVDTGTHRQGVPPEDAAALAGAAVDAGLRVAGLATHFANIEDTTDHAFALRQLARFREAAAAVRERVGAIPHVHAACSAAALLFREADFTLARLGIALYGHWPSKETYLSWLLAHGRDGVPLRPALAWRARVGQLQRVAAGEPVGYGLTWRPTRDSRLAVLPVGYSDGYPRALSNRGRVLLGGKPAPVVGRVAMNMLLADVTDNPAAAVGDVATLIGADGLEAVRVEELAELAGTINYEILARLSPALPRLVVA